MKHLKRIAILTSGGDAPGMNACVRAVVRTAIYKDIKVFGVISGYDGLIDNVFEIMLEDSVANILQRGGTILKSARSKRFKTKKGMKKAYDNLKAAKIDALVVIGGDGTFTGANEFGEIYDFPIVGLPGTIDNDLYGSDNTIGYDTAKNTVMEAVDKIRDTASSHNRLFFIEVMGKDAGFIALRSGIAVGAEDILIPETVTHIDELIEKLESGRRHNKTSGIIIIAEGDDAGGAYDVAKKVEERFNQYDTRVSVLGHLQRGGSPTCADRVLASRLGYESVLALLNGISGHMIGLVHDEVKYTPFEKAIKYHKNINRELLELARILGI